MFEVLQSNLKHQLEKKSISVAELERRTGLRHAVINIMRGRSKNPSIKVAHALAQGLGCSIEELITKGDSNKGICTTDNQHHQQIASKDCAATAHANKIQTKYNHNLGANVLNAINSVLEKSDISLSPERVMELWLESYNYCSGSLDQTVDKRFIEWLISRS